MYVEIKRIANQGLKQALVTQCMQGQKVTSDRGMDQYLGNCKLPALGQPHQADA
jgi:hypothetical protein